LGCRFFSVSIREYKKGRVLTIGLTRVGRLQLLHAHELLHAGEQGGGRGGGSSTLRLRLRLLLHLLKQLRITTTHKTRVSAQPALEAAERTKEKLIGVQQNLID
jgi:hypothetical protein